MNGQLAFGGAGQRANIPEGGKTELPIFRSWLHNLYFYDLITAATVIWEIWTLGPHLTIAIATLILLWFLRCYKWLCLFLALLSSMMIAVYYEPLFDVWPKIFSLSPDQLPGVLWGLALIPAPLWWRVWRRGEFRNSTEVTDKYAHGTIKPREAHGGAVGPDNPYGNNGLPAAENEPGLPPAQPAVQRVVRPVIAKANGKDRQEFAADAIATPDGKRLFPVMEVLGFARQLPVVGATYEGSWKDSLSVRQWQGLCAICTAAGILSERQQGSPTKVLVDTPEQSIGLIMTLVDQYDSPTPPYTTLPGTN